MIKCTTRIMKNRRIYFALVLLIFTCPVFATGTKAIPHLQSENELKEREAEVWHLGHSGWAIKTKNHLLIFDYCGWGRTVTNPAKTFGAENRDLFVFVSHMHRDHFDPNIFEWQKVNKNIQYILGWKVSQDQKLISMGPREKKRVRNIEILTIKSTDMGVGFLVKVDDLVVFHAGDFENGEGLWEAYVKEVGFIRENADAVDLAFIPVARDKEEWWTYSNNGSFYLIEKLSPKAVFPMHALGQEQFYREFANEAVKRKYGISICCAEKPGDRFFYQKGRIIDQPEL